MVEEHHQGTLVACLVGQEYQVGRQEGQVGRLEVQAVQREGQREGQVAQVSPVTVAASVEV